VSADVMLMEPLVPPNETQRLSKVMLGLLDDFNILTKQIDFLLMSHS
jgi:hypothetical protein